MVSIFDNSILDSKVSYDDEPTIPYPMLHHTWKNCQQDSGQFSPNVKLISVFAPNPMLQFEEKDEESVGILSQIFQFLDLIVFWFVSQKLKISVQTYIKHLALIPTSRTKC